MYNSPTDFEQLSRWRQILFSSLKLNRVNGKLIYLMNNKKAFNF